MARAGLEAGLRRDLLALLGGVEIRVGEDLVVVAARGPPGGRWCRPMGFRSGGQPLRGGELEYRPDGEQDRASRWARA